MPEEIKKKVDEEWKKNAEEEKRKAEEKLAQESAKKTYPPASFLALISGLSIQVMFSLGQIENPVDKKKEVDLAQAKYTIDTLQVLKEKTKGNLSPEEEKQLSDILANLQMVFVRVSQEESKGR